MTDPQTLIAQATTIHEAATPGPFRMESQASLAGDPRYCIKAGPEDVRSQLIAEEISGANAKFFATARTLVPELAAALEHETRRGAIELAEVRGEARSQIERQAKSLEEAYVRCDTLTRERDEARAELAKSGAMLKIAQVVIDDMSVCPACESKDVAARCRACGRDWGI